MAGEILRVERLIKHFPTLKGVFFKKRVASVKAIDDISFFIRKGETLGLTGESGCGKTTVARCVMRLIEPTSGKIYFHGKELTALSGPNINRIRRDITMVFQDPFSSLNSRMTIGRIIGEPLIVHRLVPRHEVRTKVLEAMDLVGLDADYYYRFPHEFSGGQRQRIGIARALISTPQLVVADEPVSALDVSIQAQILNLMQDLKHKLHLTYLFIGHNLNVVYHISDRIGVMYLGKLVEVAPVETTYQKPLHPYTQSLMAAIPTLNPHQLQEKKPLKGGVPSPLNIPEGCRFRSRCEWAEGKCTKEEPSLIEIEKGHYVACHRV
jgi:oligopeptide transport system ATP-binding protein